MSKFLMFTSIPEGFEAAPGATGEEAVEYGYDTNTNPVCVDCEASETKACFDCYPGHKNFKQKREAKDEK